MVGELGGKDYDYGRRIRGFTTLIRYRFLLKTINTAGMDHEVYAATRSNLISNSAS